ncbi:MAG: lamin tail domain-containing protein [Verrucomicrobiales bacterium]
MKFLFFRLPLFIFILFQSSIISRGERVTFSEIHYAPKGDMPEYIELFNNSGSAVDFAFWKFTDGIEYRFPDFSASNPQHTFLSAFERIIVTNVDEATFRGKYTVPSDVKIFGPYQGSLSNAGEALELEDKNGAKVCRVRYNDRGKWPVAADGAGHSIKLKNKYLSCENFDNWIASASPGGTPGAEPAGTDGQRFSDPSLNLSEFFPIVSLGDEWRYDDSGNDLGNAWTQSEFDDSSWKQGNGMFGRETASRILAMPEPKIQTEWAQRISTHYLRKQFTWEGGTDSAFFSMDAVLDDGLVVYLNGTEIGRHRMPAGVIDYQTNASSVPSSLEAKIEEKIIDADISSLLIQGTNTIAVEVHNNSRNSSDLVFGPIIRISGTGGTAVINEVRAGPAGEGFIEFYNSGSQAVNLDGYHLSNDINDLLKFTIGEGVIVPSNGFTTVGFVESGFGLGVKTSIFLSSPGAVTVIDSFEATLGADGRSVGRKPSGGSEWYVFSDPTPSKANIDSSDLAGLLSLNEIHFSDEGTIDWVELTANSESDIPLDGLALASKLDFSDAVPISGSISSNSPKSWSVSFGENGDEQVKVHLITEGGTVLDAGIFRVRNDVETYQMDTRINEWFRGAGNTKNAINDPVRETSIVINEIMSDPPSDERNGEFIELFNRGDQAVDLSGWEFVEGIEFTFDAGTMMTPGSYLVIAANKDWINENYTGVKAIGNYRNNLSNEGELLRLEDQNGNLADEVNYKVGGDWPHWTNGDGSSLELIHPFADNDLPTSWHDSDESNKTEFQEFSFSGIYHHLSVPRLDKELWVHLVGDAHVILKDIELLRNGSDILQNADKRTTNGRGETGWLPQGTHHASYFENGNFHLISDGHGDNRANKAEIQVNALNRNDELTLKFKARWVKGKPRIVFKTFEDSFVSTFRLPISNNLGSPGSANGALVSAAPPALSSLSHKPAVPKSNEPVTVSALVSGDADSVKLIYRQDSSSNDREWKSVNMNDSGSGGDSNARDGIWSAQILDQGVDNRIVQFYISATSSNGQKITLPSRAPEIPAMYVVDNDEITTDVTSYRWIVSEYDRRSLTSGSSAAWDWKFPNLSNSYKKTTLIVDEKEIFYNCQIRPSGSPWHAGDRSNFTKRGKFKLPRDKRLRALSKLSWDNTPAAEGAANIFNNKVPRYILYLMGHGVNENEFCTIIENGGRPRHSVELFEPIGNDFLERNYGDNGPQGDLYRVDDIFFFDDNYSKDQITSRYWWYAGDDWPGPGRYHSQWLLRSKETEYDYTALINLLKTVKSSNSYTENEINRLVDAQKICMMAAVRGYIGDWDTFLLRRPKNTFFYKGPDDGRFHFLFHDSDLAFQNPSEMISSGGSEFSAWLRKPYNRRIFRYYLTEILDKYQANGPRVGAWFDCEQDVSNTYNPNQRKYTSWDSGRRNRILSELSNGHTRDFKVDNISSTSEDTITVTGEAGYRVWEVGIENHPEAVFSWVDETNWKIEGISLKSGNNSLNFNALDDDGNPAEGTEKGSLNVNKTNNAAPFIIVDSDPASGNVELAQTLTIDASGSYDPEGSELNFKWESSSENAIITSSNGIAVASFANPGLYQISLEVTDAANTKSHYSKEVSVFSLGGFSSFNVPYLDSFLEEHNIESKDNYSPGAYWSLGESDGKLVIQMPDDRSYPLGLPPGISESKDYISLDQSWKYSDDNIDYMADFAKPNFDDSNWNTGKGMFGKDSGTIPEPGINTPLRNDSAGELVTYYFRTEFDFEDDPVGSEIDISAVIDDGARFWLNGIELDRVRLPSGTIEHGTGASGNTAARDEKQSRPVGVFDGTGKLNTGKNVLAVDLHNRTARSSDYLFAAELSITAQPITDGGNLDGTTHPWVRRGLPESNDWSLQTDLELLNMQFGEFMAGLIVEIEENNEPVRYAFGYKNGKSLAIVKVTSSGSAGTIHETPFSNSDDVVVRIRRSNNSLIFEHSLASGYWTEIHTLNLDTDFVAKDGGVFVSTDEAKALRVSFDYLMLSSPNSSSSVNEDIVISEIMYNPLGGSRYEFIELHNRGDSIQNLNGFSFSQGKPVDEFLFPDVTIEAGDYMLLVADQASFAERYGVGLQPKIIGVWPGGKLNNNGEEISFLDASGKVILNFAYNDNDSWPALPDNEGYSLSFNNTDFVNTSDGALWAASSVVGGTPGRGENVNEGFSSWMTSRNENNPMAVKDGELLNNLLTYALGLDLVEGGSVDALPKAELSFSNGNRFLGINYQKRADASGLNFIIEISEDLQNWSKAPGDILVVSENSINDNLLNVSAKLTNNLTQNPSRFIRIKVIIE